MAEDFNATFPSVLIPVASAHELLKCLDRWLISKTTFTAAVCSGPDQEVVLRLGEREDLLATRDKEAFTLYYSASGCRLEVYFIVDSSCVRIARDGLARELALLDSNEM